MNQTDDRLERYLNDRSTTIDLPHAGVDVITRRARRHRRRRSAAVGGVAAAVLLGGVLVAMDQPAPDEQVGSRGSSVVESPLEWSLVPVRSGLGWGSGAVSDGAAVYSLSTAAGPEGEGSFDDPRHLYRSADGTDWEDVGLPDGLYASGVAAADGAVYAVGTQAAGGEVVDVEVAVSTDGGEGWDTSTVPLDLDALGEGFPGRVRAVDAEIAVVDGTTVVAISTAGAVDPAALLPDEPADMWWQQEGGMARSNDTGTCGPLTDPPGETTTAPVSTTSPPTTAPPTTPAPPADPADAADASGAEGCVTGEDVEPRVETRTWAELGLTPEQAAVADGQTHLFVAEPGLALEPVETLAGAAYADATSSHLLAADDGWWLFSEEGMGTTSPAVEVTAHHSSDGRTWTTSPVGTAQGGLTAGVVDGRPVLVSIATAPRDEDGVDQRVLVQRIEVGGAVTTVDVNELLEVSPRAGIFAWGVGPLGVAVVLGDGASGQEDGKILVTSLDGLQFSRQDLPEAEPGTTESVNGITVTADAVKVRLNVRDEGDMTGGEPAAQRLFVGTPR